MDDIIIEQTYPYSIDKVWEALTDPASLADWLTPGDFKPVVGHKVRFHCDPLFKGGWLQKLCEQLGPVIARLAEKGIN